MAILVFPHIPTFIFLQNRRRSVPPCSSSATVKFSTSKAITSSSGGKSTGAALLWYKNDLRVDDHPGLIAALQHTEVVPLYVFDHRILRHFTEEMLELLLFAVKDLRKSLKDLGSDLMIRLGRTESVIQDLAKEVRADSIYTQEEVEYDLRPLPTLNDLKEFIDKDPYKSKDSWTSIKDSSAEYVMQNARSLISISPTNGFVSNLGESSQSNLNSLTTQTKEKRSKKSAFVTKQGNVVGGGTSDVLNALAAYLKYLEGTRRDDWQEVHEKLRNAETREGASFGTLFGPALQLGIISRRRVYYETIKYEKDRNGGFLSPFGYSAATIAAAADHVCSVEYAVVGCEGPAILLVHGFGAFLEHYRDNINDIVEGGNRVWAITLLGFGRSEKPNVIYTELMWAEILRDFIVDVVREPVHLVGNSFGGYFVSIVAGLWPTLATSVVLLNSAGHYIPGYSSVPPSKERKTTGIAWLGARGLSFYLRLSFRNLVKRCYPIKTDRADEGLLNEMSYDPGVLVVLESIFTFDPSIPLNYLLKGFEQKVLVIQGMRDPISDSKTKVSVVKRHFEEIIIKELDAGHCPHDEVPEEVNSIIREWVVNIESRHTILERTCKDGS
ncbi:DNA photolyase, N-terminal [Cynara cardunculus var. scolymus]|uniref:DNA photolyase, N-terminal n=1 Tax=Cynara cardunculus var. scolymus TaxID=59895 RepID=A0A103LJB7_CYNCS|nr:DNA photolyase, N-terminal [Cynara cardunculus var. scolymus]